MDVIKEFFDGVFGRESKEKMKQMELDAQAQKEAADRAALARADKLHYENEENKRNYEAAEAEKNRRSQERTAAQQRRKAEIEAEADKYLADKENEKRINLANIELEREKNEAAEETARVREQQETERHEQQEVSRRAQVKEQETSRRAQLNAERDIEIAEKEAATERLAQQEISKREQVAQEEASKRARIDAETNRLAQQEITRREQVKEQEESNRARIGAERDIKIAETERKKAEVAWTKTAEMFTKYVEHASAKYKAQLEFLYNSLKLKYDENMALLESTERKQTKMLELSKTAAGQELLNYLNSIADCEQTIKNALEQSKEITEDLAAGMARLTYEENSRLEKQQERQERLISGTTRFIQDDREDA